jgi:hypothetical protein
MTNSLLAFNVSKGNVRELVRQHLLGGPAQLIAIAVKAAGLEDDETLADYADLQSLLAGTTAECDFTNYSRLPLTGVNDGISNLPGENWYHADADDLEWSHAGGAVNNDIGAIIFVFDPDTTTDPHDNLIVPVTKYPWLETTTGISLTALINDFYRAE